MIPTSSENKRIGSRPMARRKRKLTPEQQAELERTGHVSYEIGQSSDGPDATPDEIARRPDVWTER